jgi:myosin heavy subunit
MLRAQLTQQFVCSQYDARQFIERNLDKIPVDLLSCARQSTNPFIRDQFNLLVSKTEGSKSAPVLKKRSEATKDLVTSKFKTQLTSLMTLIEKSRTRYIRCVKPNKTMVPRVLDHSHTVSQLQSAGLTTAILIARESFPNRLSYEHVMERYKFLCYKYSDTKMRSGDVKVDSEILLSHLLAGVTVDTHKGRVASFACGKTKVCPNFSHLWIYLRHTVLDLNPFLFHMNVSFSIRCISEWVLSNA